jgi:isopenicillin N synthase-like dioxygenase
MTIAGAHTDFGCTTILLQQPNQHGLQVLYPPTNSWIPVPAKEDVLIVNVGDLLQKWTKGEYRSAVHRVVNVSETDRYSVPFFYHGNLGTKLAPLDGSDDGEEETVEEHIRGRFVKSFGT